MDYCETCQKEIHDWNTHRYSSEHQRKLISQRGIPFEIKEASKLK